MNGVKEVVGKNGKKYDVELKTHVKGITVATEEISRSGNK